MTPLCAYYGQPIPEDVQANARVRGNPPRITCSNRHAALLRHSRRRTPQTPYLGLSHYFEKGLAQYPKPIPPDVPMDEDTTSYSPFAFSHLD